MLAIEHRDTYAAELLEHILRRWATGCFAAVFLVDDESPHPLRHCMEERGFLPYQSDEHELLVADLGLQHVALEGEQPQLIRRRARTAD